MLNSIVTVQECDARDAEESYYVWNKNKNRYSKRIKKVEFILIANYIVDYTGNLYNHYCVFT